MVNEAEVPGDEPEKEKKKDPYVEQLETRIGQLKEKKARRKGRLSAMERKREARCKIIVGGIVIALCRAGRWKGPTWRGIVRQAVPRDREFLKKHLEGMPEIEGDTKVW